MLRSLRGRLLLTYILVSGLVLAIVALSLFLFLLNSRLPEQRVLSALEFAASVLSERGARTLSGFGGERLHAALARFGVQGGRAILIGSDGEVLTDTRPDQDPPPAEVLREAGSATRESSGRYGGLLRSWLYVIAPLENGRRLLLVAPRPIGLAALGQDFVVEPLLRAGLVALAVSLMLAWLISRWVAAPLQRTARAARAVAGGDYEQRLAPSGPEEAHSLARSFNEMIQKVQISQSAMRDFVANVSHELRTPLTSIQGFAQAILDGAASQPQAVERAAQVIFDESDRLRRLVDDLLDLARLDTGQVAFAREPVDPNALLEAILERLEIKAEAKRVQLVNQVESLPQLIGDGDRLAQVFTNLIDNAIMHSPEGGTVTIRGDAAGGWVSVHIDDSGPGIPVEELSRIFERFYQLDRARTGGGGRGAGLGLAISREIAQAHGGTLTAQSELGQGSRFTVRLPRAQPEDETLSALRQPERGRRGGAGSRGE